MPDPFVRSNLACIATWRTDVLERHDKPGLLIHRLAMFADLGVTVETRGCRKIVDGMMKSLGKDGNFLLLVARVLSAHPKARTSVAARLAASAVLNYWTKRKEKKPFLFGMGRRFLKLKLPMVWYNLLHVVSALKGIKGPSSDPRYEELAGILRGKLDVAGRATLESIYLEYKTEE